MAGRFQLRRGTTAQNNAFTGAVGEPTLDTETGMIHIHDGVTQGGKEFIDAVVAFQKPTAENGYKWYRKYASGWVEQGGFGTLPAQAANTVSSARFNLPVTMANGNYTSSWERVADGGNTYELVQISANRQTTYIDVNFFTTVATSGASTVSIMVCGMAA